MSYNLVVPSGYELCYVDNFFGKSGHLSNRGLQDSRKYSVVRPYGKCGIVYYVRFAEVVHFPDMLFGTMFKERDKRNDFVLVERSQIMLEIKEE